MSFKKGDKVRLHGCPFDEQIADELLQYIELKDKTQIVIEIKNTAEEGYKYPSQWIKTNLMDDYWYDKTWFRRVK